MKAVFDNKTRIEFRSGKYACVVLRGGFGDADVAVVRTFCTATGLPLRFDGSPEAQDGRSESEWTTTVTYG